MPQPEWSGPSRPVIVVPDDFPPVLSGSSAERELRALGNVSIVTERGADREEEVIRRIHDADVVVNIRAHARFSAAVIDSTPRLRMISVWGTGTDHIDVAACRARGVTVVSTLGVNAHAVAEHTIALMLAVARRIPAMEAVVLTPHNAGPTPEVVEVGLRQAVANVREFLARREHADRWKGR
jgi:lactate dehydrogenase-like 2-hydroxyacid dehydrogenase